MSLTLTAWCEHHQIPYSGTPVATIKKHATGKGNADKAAMVSAMKARGFHPGDDNEGDALALLLWALDTNHQGQGASAWAPSLQEQAKSRKETA